MIGHLIMSNLNIQMGTTIKISDEIWEILNKKKKKGETFEDVLKKLLRRKNDK